MHKVRFVSALLASVFIVLSLAHYFSARPLWLDENLILENIKDKDPVSVFGPLKNCQAFPRFYLFVVGSLARFFGYHSLSLRFFPLLFMFCAFFLWCRIYRTAFGQEVYFFLAQAAFAAGYSFSYYAAEFKPYSADVLTAALFCIYLMRQEKESASGIDAGFAAFTLLLPFSLFFSYAGFFLFWIVFYNFIFIVRENRKILPLAAAYGLLSLLITAIVFWTDVRHALGERCLFTYWHDYFLCHSSFYCFFKSFGEGLRKIVTWFFGTHSFFRKFASFFIPFFFFSLIACGARALRRNRYRITAPDALALVLFLELLLLGVLHKFPFTGARITLFFSPFVVLLIIRGISYFRDIKPLRIALFLICFGFFAACAISALLNYRALYNGNDEGAACGCIRLSKITYD